MHIRAITPIHIDDAELERRRARYGRFSPPELTVSLVNLPSGSDIPRQLATSDDIAASDAAVARAIRALDPDEVDAALPDCVLDPGIPDRAAAAVPVHGITELAAGIAAALATPFTAVARNRAIADELDRVIARYGYRGFEPTRVLDLSFEAIADDDVWNDTVAELTQGLARTSIRHVLNGCSAVDVRPDDSGLTVFDPTRLALETLGLTIRQGLLSGGAVASHG
ncbi:MAG: aspartate/glutamate racemase family protein [Nitriliruptoraceae bacterium]